MHPTESFEELWKATHSVSRKIDEAQGPTIAYMSDYPAIGLRLRKGLPPPPPQLWASGAYPGGSAKDLLGCLRSEERPCAWYLFFFFSQYCREESQGLREFVVSQKGNCYRKLWPGTWDLWGCCQSVHLWGEAVNGVSILAMDWGLSAEPWIQ